MTVKIVRGRQVSGAVDGMSQALPTSRVRSCRPDVSRPGRLFPAGARPLGEGERRQRGRPAGVVATLAVPAVPVDLTGGLYQ